MGKIKNLIFYSLIKIQRSFFFSYILEFPFNVLSFANVGLSPNKVLTILYWFEYTMKWLKIICPPIQIFPNYNSLWKAMFSPLTDSNRTSHRLEVGHLCLPGQYRCESKECISISFVCDFIQHCQDNSDEHWCGKKKTHFFCYYIPLLDLQRDDHMYTSNVYYLTHGVSCDLMPLWYSFTVSC